jgi:hypothetical protein
VKRELRWIAAIACAVMSLAFMGWRGGKVADPPGAFQGTFTYHNDNFRTGQNLDETVLTPANVNANTFGRLFTDSVDGQIYAEPLYVPGVSIPAQGTHNVVYVATEHDTVYAFDADAAGPALWQTSLLPQGAAAIPSSDTSCTVLQPEIGITSTPVIDPVTQTIYLVAASKEGTNYVQRLHALDITTGLEQPGSPVVIQAQVPGTGSGSQSGTISFDPLLNLQRSALLLESGIVYMAFSSHCDNGPYHGWVLGYDAATLGQRYVFSDTPNGVEGGIWMSGGGIASDSSGDLYLSTGNGTFDADSAGGVDYGDTVLRLTPGANALGVTDYFTPSVEQTLENLDLDLGSGAMLLFDDPSGPNPHLAVTAGKEGTMYLLDRDHLGQFHPTDQVIQELGSAVVSLFSMPAYWNGNVFVIASGNVPKVFQLSGGLLSTTPTSQSPISFSFTGATPVISASGTSNAILWAIRNGASDASGNAVLHAFDATNLAQELYDSNQVPARDAAGPYVKFTVPTVANGRVYVPTANQLSVYGLLSSPEPTPTATPTPAPGNLVTVVSTASGIARPGKPVNGGRFRLTNQTSEAETIGAVVVQFTNPELFSIARLRGSASGHARSAKLKPPEASGIFTFSKPLQLRAGKSALFKLKVTGVKNANAPSVQTVTAISLSNDSGVAGIPAALGALDPKPPK